jgi:hypothetical protein
MAKMGRPKKEIDKEKFESMCAYQCTLEEICAFLGVTDKTLNTWCRKTYGVTFSEVFKQKREMGKMSLRRKQWKLADKSASMAIFLGKQYLGQTDKVEYTNNDAIERLDAILGGLKNNATNVESEAE